MRLSLNDAFGDAAGFLFSLEMLEINSVSKTLKSEFVLVNNNLDSWIWLVLCTCVLRGKMPLIYKYGFGS